MPPENSDKAPSPSSQPSQPADINPQQIPPSQFPPFISPQNNTPPTPQNKSFPISKVAIGVGILLIIVGLVGAGFIIYQRSSNSDSGQKSSESQTKTSRNLTLDDPVKQTTEPPKEKVTTLKTYTDTKWKFTVQYPDYFVVDKMEDPTKNYGFVRHYIRTNSSYIFFAVWYRSEDLHAADGKPFMADGIQYYPSVPKDQQEIMVDGFKAYKNVSTKQASVNIWNKGVQFGITSFYEEPNKEKALKDFEQIILTFKFLKQ